MPPIIGTDSHLVGVDKGSDSDNIIVTTNPLYVAQLTAEYMAFVERFEADPLLSQARFSQYFNDDKILRLDFEKKFAAFPLSKPEEVLSQDEFELLSPGLKNAPGNEIRYAMTNVGKFVVTCSLRDSANAISRRIFWAKQEEFQETGNSTFPRIRVSEGWNGGNVVVLEVSPTAYQKIRDLSIHAYFAILEDSFGSTGIVSAEDHPLRSLIDPDQEAERIFGVKHNWADRG